MKLKNDAQATACFGFSTRVAVDGGNGVRCIVKAVYEIENQRHADHKDRQRQGLAHKPLETQLGVVRARFQIWLSPRNGVST